MARQMTDDEFTEFVHAAWPGLYRTAYLMLGDHQLAEDLAQTALAKTYASWRKIKDPSAAPAYARVVLANTAASWFRKRGWRNEHPTELLPEPGVEQDLGTRTMLVDAIGTLAPRQRAVVVLRFYDDMSVREVAHSLGISEGTVKSQTSDALARLRDVLDDEAAGITVPPADAASVVGQGRRVRRDKHVRAVVAGATVVIVGALVAVLLRGGSGGERPEPAKDLGLYGELGAWAGDDEVHVGNHTVTVPGAAQLQYTSVGVVVSTVQGSKVLVRPNGEATTLDLDLHVSDPIGRYDFVGTDATQPYLAYVRVMDGGLGQLTVRDLSTGDEATMGAPFRIGRTRHGRVYSLWGDQVDYMRGDREVLANWRTGERLRYPQYGFVYPFGGLGHGATFGVDEDTREWVVRSRTDDAVLLEVPIDDMTTGAATLSPDGRYFATSTDRGFDVYVVATGDRVSVVDRTIPNYGWTPDGHLVGKDRVDNENLVEVCDPVTGECERTGAVVDAPLALVNPGWAARDR